MRVLFTSTPGLGHLGPVLTLMHAAREAGDEVVVAISGPGVAAAERHGFRAVEVADVPPAEQGAFWAGLPGPTEGNTYVVGELFGRLRPRHALPGTRAAVEALRPDLVVSECMELAGPLAAELAGVAHLTVGISALDMADLDTGPLVRNFDALRAELGLPPAGVVPWEHPATRLVTAVPDLLWASATAVPPGTVRYQHEDPEGRAPAGIADVWPVRGRRPRVYATLGSVAGAMSFAVPAFQAVLAGLAEVDADVLFTVGQLDRSALGPVPDHVRVESYLPQSVAMDCDVAVVHGGTGTTVAALKRGLPMVAVPLFADQPFNAARVAAAGAGLVVAPHAAAADLPGALRRVLADPSYQVRARAIAAELAALPTAATAWLATSRAASRAGALTVDA